MGRMEKRFREALYLIPIAFTAQLAWLASTHASYELQVIVNVAAITVELGILLIWAALASMRAYLETETDPLKELAESYRRQELIDSYRQQNDRPA
jgi:hypothetical protein